MSLRSNVRFALLPVATLFLAACSGTDGTSASSSGDVWTCSAVPLDGAPGLTCTAQTGTSDGTSGSSTAGGDGTGTATGTGTGTSDGTGDGTSGSPTPTTGGTSDGSNGGSGTYGCTAGSPNCPPVGAKPGTNDGSNGGGDTTGGGGGTSGSGGTTDGEGGSPTTYQCSYDASGLVTCTGTSGGGNGGNGGSPTGTTGTGTIGGSTRGCTLTQGYWKTHPSAWPVTSLTIGGVAYTETQLLALMNTAPAGDASLILADQLIAAMLNGATGTVMTDAQAWMAANKGSSGRLPYGVPSGSPAGAQAVALASQIDAYNNGLAGVPHCN